VAAADLRRVARLCLATLLLGGCTLNLSRIQDPPRSVALTTTGTWSSMIYLARTDSGVVVIDLGWLGGEGKLRDGLRRLGAEPADVRAVFLTHSHRDHVVGWRLLRGARFVVAEGEVERLTGRSRHRGPVPRLAERLVRTDLPRPGEVEVRPFRGDTLFVLGRDTLRAFSVPGHTSGSAAYLFRGVLFMGYAVGWSPLRGFRPDKSIHSDDSRRSRASVAALRERLAPLRVEWVCTAHGKCAAHSEEFWRNAGW